MAGQPPDKRPTFFTAKQEYYDRPTRKVTDLLVGIVAFVLLNIIVFHFGYSRFRDFVPNPYIPEALRWQVLVFMYFRVLLFTALIILLWYRGRRWLMGGLLGAAVFQQIFLTILIATVAGQAALQ